MAGRPAKKKGFWRVDQPKVGILAESPLSCQIALKICQNRCPICATRYPAWAQRGRRPPTSFSSARGPGWAAAASQWLTMSPPSRRDELLRNDEADLAWLTAKFPTVNNNA